MCDKIAFMKQYFRSQQKSIGVALTFLITSILFGCNETRYITERHIKNHIERHDAGQYSNLRTYVIYRGLAENNAHYLEFAGYKYNNKKALVIGIDRVIIDRKKLKQDSTITLAYEYIELSLTQAQSILNQYKVLLEKLKSEKVIANEYVYHDFTLSGDIFISFRKAKTQKGTDIINFWIRGEKYSLLQGKIIERLRQFVNY